MWIGFLLIPIKGVCLKPENSITISLYCENKYTKSKMKNIFYLRYTNKHIVKLKLNKNHYVNIFHTLVYIQDIIYFRRSYESSWTRKTDKTELESIQSISGCYFMYCTSEYIYIIQSMIFVLLYVVNTKTFVVLGVRDFQQTSRKTRLLDFMYVVPFSFCSLECERKIAFFVYRWHVRAYYMEFVYHMLYFIILFLFLGYIVVMRKSYEMFFLSLTVSTFRNNSIYSYHAKRRFFSICYIVDKIVKKFDEYI